MATSTTSASTIVPSPPPAAGSIVTLWLAPFLAMPVTLLGELEAHALLHQDALQGARHLGVGAGQDAVEELDHHHLGAEPAPHRAELQADHAGADHQQALGHLGQSERAGRGDDRRLVDGDAGQLARRPSRWR